MTRFQVTALVARRELSQGIRSKALLTSTTISLVIILALAVLPGLLSDDGPTTYRVGVDAVAAPLAERLPQVAAELAGTDPAASEVAIETEVVGAGEAEDLISEGKLDAAVVGDEVVVDQDLEPRLGFLLEEASRQVDVTQTLAASGVDDDVASQVLDPEPLAVRALDPQDEAADSRQTLTFFGTMLLYGQLFGFGYWVASGLVEEKSSRVVELLLAKARPAHLLTGKIVGIGLMAFVQLTAFVTIGLVAASAAGTVDLPPETVGIAAQVLAWFVLGFAVYSCLFAVGGALASRAEELQSTAGPASVVLIASFFAAITANSDPGGLVARIATFLPPTAPLVLPIRSAAGELAAWEAALSVGVVLASLVALVWLAARVYTRGALHVRGQLKLRQALSRG